MLTFLKKIISFFGNNIWKWAAIVLLIATCVFAGLYYFEYKEVISLNKIIEVDKINIASLNEKIKNKDIDIANLNATLANEYKISTEAQKREKKLLVISSVFHSIPLSSYTAIAHNTSNSTTSAGKDNIEVISVQDSKTFLHWVNTEIIDK